MFYENIFEYKIIFKYFDVKKINKTAISIFDKGKPNNKTNYLIS